jgi:prevent-host-death family protein
VFADQQGTFELSVRDLSRSTSGALRRVRKRERAIVTLHGRPVAMIVSFVDAIDIALAGSEGMAMLRREARQALESGELVELEGLD